jgi:MFS family permease
MASNLADGLGRTAVPLIATTLSRDPLLIALVSAMSFVPWLLFGFPAGMLVDRVDRRLAMGAANGVRVAMALVIAVSISTGVLTIWLLYACIIVWGIGETVFDTATNAVIPATVPVAGLEKANGRIQSGQLVVDTFIGAPVSGLLFAASIALPVWSTGAGYLVSGFLALLLPVSVARALRGDAPDPTAGRIRLRDDAIASLRFLAGHRLLRSLLVLTTLSGGLLSFGQASQVLFFVQTLDLDRAFLGVATGIIGVGALCGALAASALVARFGRGVVMFAATAFGGVGLLLVGVSPGLPAALASYALSAFAIAVWNVPWSALRQQLVPGDLLGRTVGFMRSLNWGVIPVATLVGGYVARLDLRAPFVIGGAGVVIVALLGVRLLLSIDKRAAGYASSSNGSPSSNALPPESAG